MTKTSTPAGLSVWEAELLEHLTEHREREAGLLQSYQRLAEKSRSAWVSYLADVIGEEEARHHRLFAELANALRSQVERTDGAAVPLITKVANRRELMTATERLLDAERDDARDLKRLSKELRGEAGHSLWPLLIQLMERDTDKHQGILEFIREQLRRQPEDA